ncbi:MAG: M20/M25/M40 family metallo-hydrolase [Gemmatimonadota bacterium]|jgi:hypothetical protein
MTRSIPILAAISIAAACASSSGPAPAAAPAPAAGIDQAAATITPDDMYARIAYLASDALKGRDTPSPGLDMAADYIANEFRDLGLTPAGDSGSYIQRYTYPRTRLVSDRTWLEIDAGGSKTRARGAVDFFVLPSTDTMKSAGLVWGGTAKPGLRFESDVTGRLVAVFMPGTDPDAAWNAAIGAAFTAAMPAGAAGVIMVLDPALDPGMISQVANMVAGASAPIPLVGLRYDVMKTALAAAGEDLDALRDGAARTLPATATLNVGIEKTNTYPPNVVGILRGSDPVLSDQYVVFSAHMDHVGTGAADATGDSIFNGADDDASGTATMMEVAEAFASLSVRPRRSMIFVAVSGEEKGLLGSSAFVKSPPVPKEKMIADINLDMVGRNAPDTVVAIGQDYSSLGPTVQAVAAKHPELGLVVAPDLWPEENLFTRSDHFNFATNGVPAIFFTTGLHEQYHKQSDEVDLIDRDKITRIGRLVFYLAYDVANADGTPAWTEAGRQVVGMGGRMP